jgi:hypothetical protein
MTALRRCCSFSYPPKVKAKDQFPIARLLPLSFIVCGAADPRLMTDRELLTSRLGSGRSFSGLSLLLAFLGVHLYVPTDRSEYITKIESAWTCIFKAAPGPAFLPPNCLDGV